MRRSTSRRLLFASCLLALFLSSSGCGRVESRINPDEPLDTLPDGRVAQLCRFTTDVLDDVSAGCAMSAPLVDFDACVNAPPWDDYGTVGAWEDCVNARLEEPCLTEPPCAP